VNDADKTKLVELTQELMDRKVEKKQTNKDLGDDIKRTEKAIKDLMMGQTKLF
jgi:hypothetical protein